MNSRLLSVMELSPLIAGPRGGRSDGRGCLHARKMRGEQLELLVGVALRELVHDGGGTLACLEVFQCLKQVVPVLPRQARRNAADAAAIRAVTRGAGGGKTAHISGILRVCCQRSARRQDGGGDHGHLLHGISSFCSWC